MTITSSTSIRSDIVSTVTNDQGNNNIQRYSYKLNYSSNYTYGTGTIDQSGISSPQVNLFGFNSGTLSGNESVEIDFKALQASNLGSVYDLSFDRLHGIVIENVATGTGQILTIAATGANAFTNLFNGGSGNLAINPNGTFMYTDIYGTIVPSGSSKVFLYNTYTGEIDYKIVTIGVDNDISGISSIPTP